jgi:hypothetical protein
LDFLHATNADQANKRTVLSVREPMKVRDTLLTAGQHVLKVCDTGDVNGEQHIVQITAVRLEVE